MKKSFSLRWMTALFLVCAFHISSWAQTVSPVTTVFTEGGKDEIVLRNNSMKPMIASLQMIGFRVNENGGVDRLALDSHVHVRFSQNSVQLAPLESKHVFFSASADSYPAWFMIDVTFSDVEKHAGINVDMELGHPVYMYQKEPIYQADVSIPKAVFDLTTRKLNLQIANHGKKLARPFITFPQLHDNMFKLRAYPVFPGQVTQTGLDLSGVKVMKDRAISEIELDFGKFKLPVHVTSISSPPAVDTPSSPSIEKKQ